MIGFILGGWSVTSFVLLPYSNFTDAIIKNVILLNCFWDFLYMIVSCTNSWSFMEYYGVLEFSDYGKRVHDRCSIHLLIQLLLKLN